MGTLYDIDVVAWSLQQAALLRARRWAQLDLDNIADEIESVGRAEQRQLESRFAVLITHLLRWCCQPRLRGNGWRHLIDHQRGRIARHLKKTPSLRHDLANAEWVKDVWVEAVVEAEEQTDLQTFPPEPVWTVRQMLDAGFFPDALVAHH